VKGLYSTEGVTSPVRRFNICLWANQEPIMGLLRVEAVNRIRPCRQIMACDLVYLMELAIVGQFVYVHDAIFYRRHPREPEDRATRMQRKYRALFFKPGRPCLPYFRVWWEITLAAWRTPLRGKGWRRRRLRVQLLLSSLSAVPRFLPYMVEDILALLALGGAATRNSS
jgi:hypothetical protein